MTATTAMVMEGITATAMVMEGNGWCDRNDDGRHNGGATATTAMAMDGVTATVTATTTTAMEGATVIAMAALVGATATMMDGMTTPHWQRDGNGVVGDGRHKGDSKGDGGDGWRNSGGNGR